MMLRFVVRLSLLLILLFAFLIEFVMLRSAPDVPRVEAQAGQRGGAFREVLRYGRGVPQSVHWQPGGDIILVNSISGVWLYTDTLTDLHHFPTLRDARFSPDGRWIIGKESEDEAERTAIYDAASFERVPLPEPLYQTKFSPDSAYLAGLNEHNALIVLDTQTFQPLEMRAADIETFEWSPDSAKLAVLNQAADVLIWTIGGTITTLHKGHQSGYLRWSPDSQHLLMSVRNDIIIWNNLDPSNRVDIPGSWVWEGYQVITLWHSSSAQVLAYFVYDEYTIMNHYDARTGKLKTETLQGYFFDVKFNQDGSLLATSTGLFDPQTFERLADIMSNGIHFSPDGQYIAWSPWFSKEIWITEIASGESVTSLTGAFLEDGMGLSVVWSPDSRKIVSSDASGLIVVWDVTTSSEIARLTAFVGSHQVIYSDDRLVAVSDRIGNVRIWDYKTGAPISTLTGHQAKVSQMVWQPGGHMLATITSGFMSHPYPPDSGVVRVWDTGTGRLTETLEFEVSQGGIALVNSIVWRPDGEFLAYTNSYPHIYTWAANGRRQAYLNDFFDMGVGHPYIHWIPEADVVWSSYYKGMSAWRISTKQLLIRTGWESYKWQAETGRLYITSTIQQQGSSVCSTSVTLYFDPKISFPTITRRSITELTVLSEIDIPIFTCDPIRVWNNGGTHLAITDGKQVQVWDVEMRKPVLSHWYRGVEDFVWSPEDSQLGLRKTGNVVQIIDLATHRLLLTVKNLVGWSPKGAMVVTFENCISTLWAVATGQSLLTVRGNIAAWSADETSFAVLNDGIVTLWARE
jgi:WD40 repeat protein